MPAPTSMPVPSLRCAARRVAAIASGSSIASPNLAWTQVNPGDKVGLIGANGAGKATVLNLLLGAQRPGAGSVVVGSDLGIGHVPQQLEAPPEIMVRDFLLGEVAPVEEAQRAAERALAEAAEGQIDVRCPAALPVGPGSA